MTTENIKITQPVEVKTDSKARVALDLMDHISRRETIENEQNKTREYWLTLYVQCMKAANGEALEYVLQKK